ncbi:MAG TPA: CDP-glycerol glycerophosphotransferase family protein [Candidatus Mediterraneibacter merdipullorum]|nr:CDP-glycerol glycerophosphotransferase family protein [Candidatus Mediterraneibacter merdipullorum]
MDILAVMKHTVTKGPFATYRLHKKRQEEKAKKERERLRKLEAERKARLSEEENVRLMSEFDGRIKEKYGDEEISKSVYEKELKAFWIKEVYPKIYNEEAQKPVEHKVVFMERGNGISASLKYMLNYMKKNTDYEIKKFSLMGNTVEPEVYYKRAKDYIREIATAKAIFICTANDLTGYFKIRPETTYIQLWHGCGVFKKVGLSTIDKAFGKSAESHKEYPINTNYSYVTIASPELSWIFEESMGIDKDAGIIVPTGVSRSDEFFDPQFIENSYKKLYEKIPQAEGKKVILYAPTFRGEVATCTSPDVLDVKAFAEAFSDEYILIFKHHQSVKNVPPIPEEYENTFAFDMTRGKGMNINELMTVSDICISDYSSLVFEYSLFERPMIFFAYDLEDYIDVRGLYYDFDEITPGPIFRTNEEIIDYIRHIDERFNKQEVIDFKNRFMNCCDGHASERIAALIK